MTNSIRDQLEQAILTTVKRGRWFAEEWEEAEILPNQRLRSLLPQALQRLTNGEPLAINDEEALELMAEDIKQALNNLKPGYGDLAMRIDTSEHLIFDEDRERLRKLAERWKSFRNSRRHIRDLQATIRQTKLALMRAN